MKEYFLLDFLKFSFTILHSNLNLAAKNLSSFIMQYSTRDCAPYVSCVRRMKLPDDTSSVGDEKELTVLTVMCISLQHKKPQDFFMH